MAPKLKKYTAEGIGIFLVLITFVFLLGKYFMPEKLIARTYYFLGKTTMNIAYAAYSIETLTDKRLRQGNTETAAAAAIPILLYHGLPIFSLDGSDVSRVQFHNQMVALKRAGWETITLEEFYDFLQGNKVLPEKSFLLTFDDGVRTTYTSADPILKALDYNAVMFIITKFSLGPGSSYYLSKREVKDMLASGRWEIQSHGEDAHLLISINEKGDLGHFLSNKKWLADQNRFETTDEYRLRILEDFEISKEKIESLGVQSIAYAFPFGDFGQGSVNIENASEYVLTEAGKVFPVIDFFQFWPSRGFTFNSPATNSGRVLIHRITVEPQWDTAKLTNIFKRGSSKALPLTDTLEENTNGWISVWGDLVFEHDGITISSSETTTGGLSFLDGTQVWGNGYRFSADGVTVETGHSFSLVVLYQNVDNYVSCAFEKDSIAIYRYQDGQMTTLARVPGDIFSYEESLNASASIEGTTISCNASGLSVKATLPADTIVDGGVALKTWDSNINNSSVHLDTVEFTALD